MVSRACARTVLVALTLVSALATPALAAWQSNGNPVVTAPENQSNLQTTAAPVCPPALPCYFDLVLVWEDRRDISTSGIDLYWALVDPAGGVSVPGGAPVVRALGDQASQRVAYTREPSLLQAPQFAIVVAWVDTRNGQQDIYAQRLLDPRFPPAWPGSGVAVCTAPGPQFDVALAGDDSGAVIVAWIDERSGAPAVYAQRLDRDGNALWAADGVPVCSAAGSKTNLQAAPVSPTGAYLAWVDGRSGQPQVYALRLLADGSPAPGWTADGVQVAPSSGSQELSRLVTRGPGGIWLTFTDDRADPLGDAFAQSLLGDGSRAADWPVDGAIVNNGPGAQELMDADGVNDLVVCWAVSPSTAAAATADRDLYATRLLGDGTRAPGWSADGNAVCVRPGDVADARVLALSDGYYFTWADARSATTGLDIYAQRLLPDGERDSRWPSDGVVICDAPGDQHAPVIGPDGLGAAMIAWEDDRDFATSMTDIYAQIVNQAGEVDVPLSRPATFRLMGPRPNPSRGVVEFVVESPSGDPVDAAIYDLAGREVWRAAEGEAAAPGLHRLLWDGKAANGRSVAPGVYYLRMRVGDRSESRRLVRLQ